MKITLLSIIFLVGCSQKNAHQLTATEEFTLRGKCAELGHQLEQAKDADDAALQLNDDNLEKLTNKLLARHTRFHSWSINYNGAQNRCYALDKEQLETLPADGSKDESDPPVTVLYDAQTQEVLARIWIDAGQIKHGKIMRIDSVAGADDVGYDAAKKFIDERMAVGETR